VLIAIQNSKRRQTDCGAYPASRRCKFAFEGGRYSCKLRVPPAMGDLNVIPVGEAPAGALPEPQLKDDRV